MFNTKTTLFFFFCAVAVGNASIRGHNRVLREQADGETATYNNVLSTLDEMTLKKIHQRFLMDKIVAESDARELQESEASMSLSLSMSLPVPASFLSSDAKAVPSPKIGKSARTGRAFSNQSKSAKRDR
ncbi:hypothetical protein IV203_021055 [Nitzschia inconspicua]|uniref:Uncharacterized protein n=1 Tax=Nitzschia inconspicua TaxID=303405 RepID=A0A9K3KH79_9STRA|nr:hypothetical protein IV203_021055 [Nitzschia inconspicua]